MSPSDPRPVLGISTCVFRARKVLLVERANPPFQGLLSLPGGRLDFGERLEEAARREVLEETALAIDRLLFFCLHESIEGDVHVVIAVHRAASELPVGIEPVAGDDARSCAFHDVATLPALQEAGRLTPGLAAIVDSAHRSHLLGL